MHEAMLLSEKPEEYAYEVALSGGNSRFLRFTDFLAQDIDGWIEIFAKFQPNVVVHPPANPPGFRFDILDALCAGATWDQKLRLHHALGKIYQRHDAPSYIYEAFHTGLLLNDYAYEEFERAWVVEALGNAKLKDSLAKSPDHIVFTRTSESMSPRYIFRKTPFVLMCLAGLQKEAERRAYEAKLRATEDEREAKARAEVAQQERKQREEKQAELAAEVAKQREAELARLATEKARLAAEDAERRIQLSTKRNSKVAYTLTLAPGVIRYIDFTTFIEADVERWISLIGTSALQPRIQTPREEYHLTDFDFEPGVNLGSIDELFPNCPWQEKLRMHHILGRAYREQRVPSCVYHRFHQELQLSMMSLHECLAAWVKEAWDDDDVAESFVGASDYWAVTTNDRSRLVFRKTPFVVNRMAELSQQAERDKAATQEAQAARVELEELERLRRSKFSTFVYVMEDLRNGHFKIGRSATPGKRERTLQSEVPQIVLRFSIPADVDHERELHERFDDKRQRGEWFALSPDDLLWLMSFLKQHGDGARVAVDHQWFTKIFFNGAGQP